MDTGTPATQKAVETATGSMMSVPYVKEVGVGAVSVIGGVIKYFRYT